MTAPTYTPASADDPSAEDRPDPHSEEASGAGRVVEDGPRAAVGNSTGAPVDPVESPLPPNIRRTPLSLCNPVTKIGIILVLMFAVLLSIDVVSAGIVLALELAFLPLAGVRMKVLLSRLWILPVAALFAGWGTALLSEKTGTVVLDLGPLLFTTDSLLAGLAIFLRSLALGIPAFVLAQTIDPTDLADGLVQKLHLPQRFVLASLAATRLVSLLQDEWRTLSYARRARGVEGNSAVGRILAMPPLAFRLLVQAIRRGTRLAMAMEGRGFGAEQRSWMRVSRFHARDAWCLLTSVACAAIGVGAALWLGTWTFLGT